MRTGPKFEIFAENDFADYSLEPPAVSDGQIFIRTNRAQLWAIGQRQASLAFYRGDGCDHRGRSLSDIHEFDFYELEFNHDYIQWLFPLPEPSGASASAPILSNDDIAAFESDESLRKSAAAVLRADAEFFGLESADASDEGGIRCQESAHF